MHEPLSFSEMIKKASLSEASLFCYEGDGTVSLKDILALCKDKKSFAIIIGSEGGFSKEEFAAAKEAGFYSVNLGPRILRCETAPVYALSCLSFFFEL